MAEAEDLVIDAARHATAYTRALLARRRPAAPAVPALLELAPRLDLLLAALHGRHWPLRVAQPPARVTILARLFMRRSRPWREAAVPASDGRVIWLPRRLDGLDAETGALVYRTMALHQAWRGGRRDAAATGGLPAGLAHDLYLVIEAFVAGEALSRQLPGLRGGLATLRAEALRRRPPLERFPSHRQGLERWYRGLLDGGVDELAPVLDDPASIGPAQWAAKATDLADRHADEFGAKGLFKDWWTGDWPQQEGAAGVLDAGDAGATADDERPARSARLSRRPTVREAGEDEDDDSPGAWMVQTAQPHESAEDPMGMQRPADRDTDDAPESHAESVADLAQARLVRSAKKSHEFLLSDDPPPTGPARSPKVGEAAKVGISYPEWDYRRQAYLDPGTTVWEMLAEPGSARWVERTLEAQRGMLAAIRRRFEMLRAHRVWERRQEDGDELDLEACIDARADLRAGGAMPARLYRSNRARRRDTAVLVLVDISGSTDAWVAGDRRIIDVEREALLPLSIALDGSGDAHAILAFSGEGPQRVLVRTVKRFDERHGDEVARRIAGLEPEDYTRAGAAIRHASRLLAGQPARHRLLLLLSDGKPNDQDHYEGRYGVEDMRQAVQEARLAGHSPFCLTVDRQAAGYLPRVFGPQHYALLQQPERLPMVLLDWMKRLLAQ